MTTDQPTLDQQLLWHAQRQTSALETIRNYVFYLLLLAVLGVIFGVILGISSSGF